MFHKINNNFHTYKQLPLGSLLSFVTHHKVGINNGFILIINCIDNYVFKATIYDEMHQ